MCCDDLDNFPRCRGGRYNGPIEFQYTLEESGNAADQQQQMDAQNTPDYIGLLELVHDSDISTCQWCVEIGFYSMLLEGQRAKGLNMSKE